MGPFQAKFSAVHHARILGQGGSGLDRASSPYALDSRFEPRSVYKYGCFSPKLKGLMGNEVSEWGRDRKALSSDITHPSIA